MKVKELFKVLESTKFSAFNKKGDAGDKVYLRQISASGSYFTPPHDGYKFKVYRNGRIKQEIYFDLYDEVSESILEEEVISVEELNIYLEQYKNNCSIVIKVGN